MSGCFTVYDSVVNMLTTCQSYINIKHECGMGRQVCVHILIFQLLGKKNTVYLESNPHPFLQF
jgi:hypothetical protein